MFDKFGEMNSSQEINELAENLFNENDIDSLKTMAKENGISQEYVDDYLKGNVFNLCDPLTAALGKLDIEKADLKPTHLMKDWVGYIEGQCLENDAMAAAVRKKGKSLKGCIGQLLKEGTEGIAPAQEAEPAAADKIEPKHRQGDRILVEGVIEMVTVGANKAVNYRIRTKGGKTVWVIEEDIVEETV